MRSCRETIAAFESAFRCHVCFHDYDGRITACAGPFPLHHRNLFCEGVAKDRRSFLVCCEMEAVLSRARLQSGRRAFLKRCHAGVFELAVPVFCLEALTGAMFVGPFREAAQAPGSREELLEQPCQSPCRAQLEGLRERLPSLDARQLEELTVFAELTAGRIEDSFELEKSMPQDAPYGRKIRYFIDCNFRRDVYLSELAAALGVGEVRTCQLLRKLLGTTFSKALAARRVEHARYLLKESSLKTGAVSSECGFSDPAYFFRVFKEGTGMTPGHYRRRFQAGASPGGRLLA